MGHSPVRVCVIDDYDVVVAGTAAVLADHGDLVDVVEATTDEAPDHRVDVALLDCFALPGLGAEVIAGLADHPNVGRVAVFAWTVGPEVVEAALASGASGFIGKGLPGRELAEAILAVHRGERVVAMPGADGLLGEGRSPADDDAVVEGATRRWPGTDVGLTERESEVLALITQGKRTSDIAEALYIGVNSVKTHTQKVFRKIGVSTRTEAALWGIDRGFRPDRSSAETWRRRDVG